MNSASPINPTDPADPTYLTDPADPTGSADNPNPNPLDLPEAPKAADSSSVEHEAAAFIAAEPIAPYRPENESTSRKPGFVGYITGKRGPEMPPTNQPAPHFTPAGSHPGAPVTHPPLGPPGVRFSTVLVGLILLVVGLSALTSQFSETQINPGAMALAVMLGAGIALMAAAIRRSQKSD